MLSVGACKSKGRVTQAQKDHRNSATCDAEWQRGLQQGCHLFVCYWRDVIYL